MSSRRTNHPAPLRRAFVLAIALLFSNLALASQKAGPQEIKAVTRNIRVLHIRGNLYMLVGSGCNITVQVGDQYVIVVDTGTPALADEVIATVHELSSLPILFVANTTSDADHTGGNTKFYQAGWALPNATMGFEREKEKGSKRLVLPSGASIIASAETVDRTADPSGKTSAITYGTEGFQLYNDEPVLFYYMPKAHANGDTMVFFRSADVVSAGDIFTTTGYPKIDAANGGSINGLVDALNDLIELLVPRRNEEGGTYVVPGHGYLADRADVVHYRDMVTIIRGRIQQMIQQGMTLDQVQASAPTADYDGIYGKDEGRQFTEAVYRDLTKSTSQAAQK
jgi:glyoxylase-like metal-dependent hydrolase (beta-lactamase superfamily II)